MAQIDGVTALVTGGQRGLAALAARAGDVHIVINNAGVLIPRARVPTARRRRRSGR